MATDRITLTIPGPDGDREVGLSSPDRVLWPAVGITKRELAEYLLAVAGPFLAANGHRPVSLERYPDSIEGEMFFPKNPPKGAPSFIETVTVTYNSGRRHPQIVPLLFVVTERRHGHHRGRELVHLLHRLEMPCPW